MKVDRDLVQAAAVLSESRHIAMLRPAFAGHPDPFLAAVVIAKGIHAAAR